MHAWWRHEQGSLRHTSCSRWPIDEWPREDIALHRSQRCRGACAATEMPTQQYAGNAVRSAGAARRNALGHAVLHVRACASESSSSVCVCVWRM